VPKDTNTGMVEYWNDGILEYATELLSTLDILAHSRHFRHCTVGNE